MATQNMNSDRFPVGATVGVYPRTQILSEQRAPTLIPDGSTVTTAVVAADGSLSFTGLADDTAYVAAYDSGGGVYRKVRFRTPKTQAQLDALRPSWKVRRQALGLK